MFGDSLNRLKKLEAKNVSASVPPSHFEDPIALKTEWTGYPGGGQSYRLNRVSPTRWEFRRSGGTVMLGILLIVLGLGILSISAHNLPVSVQEVGDANFMVPILIGGFFIMGGLLVLGSTSTRLIFDKDCGYFFKAKGRADVGLASSNPGHRWELDRIHALQLIARHYRNNEVYVLGRQTSFDETTVYETNLVLKDASRLNLTGHRNLSATREDARALSEFLGKPLWDSI